MTALEKEIASQTQRLHEYEAELAHAATLLQEVLPIGQVKAIGLREVAAGVVALRERLAAAEAMIHEIVCTEPPDDGVVLLSNDSPCHWDAEANIDVYDHVHFSPLGDALMKLYRVLSGEQEAQKA